MSVPMQYRRSGIVYAGRVAGLYEKVYRNIMCGWVGQIGYGQDTVWATNTFRAGEKEELETAAFLCDRTRYGV